MIHKKGNKKDKKSMKLPNTIGLSMTIFLIVMIFAFSLNDIETEDFYPLQEYMSTDVTYKDGTTAHFDDGDFGSITKNERLIVHINLPSEINLETAELYIPLYNAVLNVYLDDTELFYDRVNSNNISTHYGNHIYEIPLPSDYNSKEIILDITSVVSMPYSDLNGIGIIPANQGWKRIIASQSIIFSLSLTLMIMAIICVFYFLIRSISLRKIQLGLPIALFELLINAWFFGSLRMFYLILGNMEFCSKVEYYSLYLAPLPLAAFIYTVVDVPFFKKLLKGIISVYTLYYVTATFIELSPIQRNYSDMLTSMHLLTGTTIVIMVVALFAGTKHKTNQYIFILRYGVLISMLCGILELARFNITKYILNKSWVSTHGVSAIAILVIAVSLVIYLISVSADEYTSEIERKQLMVLAYKDPLTDISNRAACYKSIEEMEEKDIKEYTMVFIDLNNLKVANDNYGHDIGDLLIKTVASHINETFSESGFCGRWGGDEFVACVFGSRKNAENLVEEFLNKIREEDKSGTFPFKVSAACGLVSSDAEDYLDPLEAIRQADAIMYENKKLMKAARA